MDNRPRQMDFFFKGILHSEHLSYKDDRELMTVPMVHLGTRERTTPIIWTHPDKNNNTWVKVQSAKEYSIANIHDLDVVLFVLSNIADQLNKGVKRPEKTVKTTAYNLLKSIGRNTGGVDYENLKNALRRLKSTTIETNIRTDTFKQNAMFSWIGDWVEDPNSKEIYITCSEFLYKGIVDDKSMLTVHPDYFKMQSGILKYLYRLARRSVGKEDKKWEWTMTTLHERSASLSSVSDFKKNVRKVIDRVNKDGNFPEYNLEIIGDKKTEKVIMTKKKAEIIGEQP